MSLISDEVEVHRTTQPETNFSDLHSTAKSFDKNINDIFL